MTEQQRPAWGRAASRQLDDWLAILPDGSILAYSGKVEVGTGVRTGLAQIVAEELDVPLDMVHMVMGDTERTQDEGYTAGSMTIRTSGGLLRKRRPKPGSRCSNRQRRDWELPVSKSWTLTGEQYG